jgi:ArsR family transcriptional regulator, arsenate/arsenite/antimonite-responsive transcriptional repressor
VTSIIVESTSAEARAALFSALGDPNRLRILDELAGASRCVCELQEVVGVAPNLLSYHLRVLREAGLVEPHRRGRWIDYELSADGVEAVRAAIPAGGGRE